MNAQTCPSCSSPIVGNSRFCAHCGSGVGLAVASPSTLLTATAPNGAMPLSSQSSGHFIAAAAPPAPPSVTVNIAAPAQQNTVVVMDNNNGPGFGIRAIWFLFVGWWLTFLWIGLAWTLNLTLIGLPLGLMMINRVPQVLTLRSDRRVTTVTQLGNTTIVSRAGAAQLSMGIRAVYFFLIGWWASLAWAYLAWGLCVLIVTLPIGLVMFNYLPQVTTLRRN
jgi:uncharacterized membrane protein YccF (DUF307 family)